MDVNIAVHTTQGHMTEAELLNLCNYIQTKITSLGLTELDDFGKVTVEASTCIKGDSDVTRK